MRKGRGCGLILLCLGSVGGVNKVDVCMLILDADKRSKSSLAAVELLFQKFKVLNMYCFSAKYTLH